MPTGGTVEFPATIVSPTRRCRRFCYWDHEVIVLRSFDLFRVRMSDAGRDMRTR